MSTLGTLKAEIADQLNRSDLTDQIADRIPRAIRKYADRRFVFNEAIKTATTTASTTDMSVPTGLRKEKLVQVTIGGTRYQLIKTSAAEIEIMQGWSDSTGQPTHYAYLDGKFRFWPTPDQVYTITVLGIYDEADLGSDSATNAWTDEARELIAAQVVYWIARDILRDEERMRNAMDAMRDALEDLVDEAADKQARGRIVGHM